MARGTRESWGRRVERWRRSGLTADQFAAREGVNARTLVFWKWRLKRDGVSEGCVGRARRGDEEVAFVELVSAAPSIAPSCETHPTLFEVALPSGYRVRMAHGFERAALAELLDVLEARR